MLTDFEKRQMFELAESRRHNGINTRRFGYVKEVKQEGGERKIRVVMGFRMDGSEWLSPWLHTEEHRSGSRHQALIEKGMNVAISLHGGDFRQATVSPAHEAKHAPQPQHATKINGDTRQVGKLHESWNKSGGESGGSGGENFQETWLSDQDEQLPKHQDQQATPLTGGGGGAQQQQQQQQQQSGGGDGKAKMKQRLSEKGGLTGRVGEDSRYAAHEKGAKIKKGQNVFWTDAKGTWVFPPPKLAKDGIPDDNA